jgi:HNH endonuclease
MDIRFLFENTTLTQAQIGEQLGITQKRVSKLAKKLYSASFRKARKVKCYSSSKLGDKNPMFNKLREEHHNYIGVVSDNKGYWMRLKPDWYTGRKNSKHVFEHHIVVCENLGITEVPKGWNVHHCDSNPQNNTFENLVLLTVSDHQRLHWALKGATTISKESTLKWVEAHGTPWRDDIVSSTWEHVAVINGQELTTPVEDK